MKKIIITILLVCALLTLCACKRKCALCGEMRECEKNTNLNGEEEYWCKECEEDFVNGFNKTLDILGEDWQIIDW